MVWYALPGEGAHATLRTSLALAPRNSSMGVHFPPPPMPLRAAAEAAVGADTAADRELAQPHRVSLGGGGALLLIPIPPLLLPLLLPLPCRPWLATTIMGTSPWEGHQLRAVMLEEGPRENSSLSSHARRLLAFRA